MRQSGLNSSKQRLGAPRRSVLITIKISTFTCIYFPLTLPQPSERSWAAASGFMYDREVVLFSTRISVREDAGEFSHRGGAYSHSLPTLLLRVPSTQE